jgi:hypothetical protein
MAFDDLRTEVSVFEPRDSDVLHAPHPRTTRTDTEGHGGCEGRIVDLGAELFAMTAAVVYAQTAIREPPRAGGRDSGAGRGLLQPGSAPRGAAVPRAVEQRRAANHRLALDVISGRHTWLAAGIIDPSAGEGPMVPSAETDRGESSCLRATTAGPENVRDQREQTEGETCLSQSHR